MELYDRKMASAFVEALNSSDVVVDTSTANVNGEFKLSRLPDNLNDYSLRVTHPDFKVFTSKISDITSNDDKEVVITLQHEDSCCARIELTVKRASDSSVVSGAEVRLNREHSIIRKTSTNDDGRVVFEKVCDGHYWVRIAKEGFTVIEQPVVVTDCDTVKVTYYMQEQARDTCCDGVIKIYPRDKETGEFLNGAEIKIWKKGQLLGSLKSENGNPVIFRELCKGTYGFDIFKNGYKHIEFQVEIDCNETKEVSKTLEKDTICCDGVIIFTARNHDNQPLKDVSVRLWKGNQKLSEQKTNEEGKFIFRELCKGTYAISFSKEGYTGAEFTVNIDCGDTIICDKTLGLIHPEDTCCNGKLKVLVNNHDNNTALNGSTVKIWKNGQLLATKTVENGYVVFEKLCKGLYGLDILKEGFKHIEFQVEIDCNEVKVIEKALVKNETDTCCDGKIIVYAIDSTSGSKLANATIKLRKGSTIVQTKTSDANGSVAFENVCKGSYNIAMLREGYKTVEFEFNIDCNATLEYHKKMLSNHPEECCTAVLKLKILDDSTETAIANARVEIYLDGQIVSDPRSNDEITGTLLARLFLLLMIANRDKKNVKCKIANTILYCILHFTF
jgi:5-hydroxyisourate hydrolase-like protein (transthyretin family)